MPFVDNKFIRTVGDAIKDMRECSDMTQAELAQKVGLATITIRQYENGSREPRFKTLQHIADALECDISDLIPSPNENPEYFKSVSDKLNAQQIQNVISFDLANSKEHQQLKILETLFKMLNDLGKQTAIWRINELTQIPKYRSESDEHALSESDEHALSESDEDALYIIHEIPEPESEKKT